MVVLLRLNNNFEAYNLYQNHDILAVNVAVSASRRQKIIFLLLLLWSKTYNHSFISDVKLFF